MSRSEMRWCQCVTFGCSRPANSRRRLLYGVIIHSFIHSFCKHLQTAHCKPTTTWRSIERGHSPAILKPF